jgi:hypothetical protein
MSLLRANTRKALAQEVVWLSASGQGVKLSDVLPSVVSGTGVAVAATTTGAAAAAAAGSAVFLDFLLLSRLLSLAFRVERAFGAGTRFLSAKIIQLNREKDDVHPIRLLDHQAIIKES